MTTQHPEALRQAAWLKREGASCQRHYDLGVLIERQHTRIAELEAQLEAIGAGGVNGPLVGSASPPPAQAEGWRSMETAPKDKSNIVLLRQPCGSIANGFWLAEAYAGNGAWIWPYVHKTPTHWMPLPPPPTSAETAKATRRARLQTPELF